MKTVLSVIAVALFSLCLGSAEAAPKRIILIRHADKLPQKIYGEALSPKGQVRAEKLVGYYLKRFGTPDFIFATHPMNRFQLKPGDKLSLYEFSIRELQTVGPLANQITKTTGKNVPIHHPYQAEQYDELGAQLLKDPKYNGKDILVCWDHFNIPHVLKALGVDKSFPPSAEDTFDDVWVILYKPDGSVKKVKLLKNQYPVEDPGSWADLSRCSSACGKAHSSR